MRHTVSFWCPAEDAEDPKAVFEGEEEPAEFAFVMALCVMQFALC
jgi:hypothetical protein